MATRCHILRIKCTKFDYGGAAPEDPAGGAYSASPSPLAGLRTLLLMEWIGGNIREERGGEEM